jgi:hypothetical protein
MAAGAADEALAVHGPEAGQRLLVIVGDTLVWRGAVPEKMGTDFLLIENVDWFWDHANERYACR